MNFHSLKDVESLVSRSSHAQLQWSSVSLLERIDAVNRAYGNLKRNTDSLALDITNMMGKPLNQAKGEINTSVDR